MTRTVASPDEVLQHVEEDLHVVGVRPMVGSSKTNSVPSWRRPISEANLSLCALAADRGGCGLPSVR